MLPVSRREVLSQVEWAATVGLLGPDIERLAAQVRGSRPVPSEGVTPPALVRGRRHLRPSAHGGSLSRWS